MAKLKSTRVLTDPSRSIEFADEMFAGMYLASKFLVKLAEAYKLPITVIPSKDGKTHYVSNDVVSAIDKQLFE